MGNSDLTLSRPTLLPNMSTPTSDCSYYVQIQEFMISVQAIGSIELLELENPNHGFMDMSTNLAGQIEMLLPDTCICNYSINVTINNVHSKIRIPVVPHPLKLFEATINLFSAIQRCNHWIQ